MLLLLRCPPRGKSAWWGRRVRFWEGLMCIAHAIVILAVIASPAGAVMVKCQGSGGPGSVVYQDVPCARGKELRNFDTDPANVSVVPAIVPRPLPGDAQKARPLARTTAG